MKALFYEGRVEILKIISATLSIGTIVLLSQFLGNKYLVSYVVIQTLLVVFASVTDFGLNVTNKNVDIPYNSFRTTKVPTYLFVIASLSYLGVTYFWFINDISNFAILLMPISIISSIYNLRWLTVKRRNGEVFLSVLYGEFSLSVLRLISVVVGLLIGYVSFEVSLLFFPILVSVYLSRFKSVDGLKLIHPVYLSFYSEKFDIFAYILSVFIAIKNQILSLFIPTVNESSKSYVIMVSRIYGAIVILMSGLIARVPYSIRIAKIDKDFKKLKIIISLIVFSFISISLLYPFYIGLISNIFNVGYPFDFSTERQIFFILIVFGIVQSSLIVSLQALNKNKIAILFDVIYLLVVVSFMAKIR